ncbi:hypothetical protein [Acetobacter orientalis]|uniref:Uncharacterized protein n=1 Tax=Acetobacter orientalis TaxID=146474 RepID=A0A0D6NLC7_9PROT|nr:hypothetical protein [Acetobacter orientalis]GAN66887.1 hypothetical protein Abor_031_053 [Acetobacter orientalis]GBR14339.1 hypothetical protein AA0481_0586 [Acetobacter orientalis NRIC 0481]GEL60868.1 hypothetical protein AOR02nite_07100 [Acetobacter orientalis]
MNAVAEFVTARNPAAGEAIVEWILRLSVVVRSNPPVTKTQAVLYAEMLIRDVPPAAFTTDALHYVASQCEWFPAVKVLTELLTEQWKSEKIRRQNERASGATRIAGPMRSGGAPLAGMDLEWRRYWDRREFTGWKDEAEHSVEPWQVSQRKKAALSLIRSKSPLAYEAITGRQARPVTDNAAWSDPVVVRKQANAAKGSLLALQSMLRTAVQRYAPENMGIVEEVLGKSA